MMGPNDDVFMARVLLGLIDHPEARERARRLGPNLFPEGAARDIAASIVADLPYPEPFDAETRAEAEALVSVMELVDGPVDARHAVRLVNILAAERQIPLLLDALAWAGRQLRNHASAHAIRNSVIEALDLCEVWSREGVA